MAKARMAEPVLTPAILVLHGPNLNLLGTREPDHYGFDTLDEINCRLQARAEGAGVTLEAFQSNAEHELVARIHRAWRMTRFMIVNPAAFTHTSIAIRDAIAAVNIPFIVVHLSNVHAREPFRRHSYFSDIALGVITGLGPKVYDLALEYALQDLMKASHGSKKAQETH